MKSASYNTAAAPSPTVPLQTTPESCQRSELFPGQLPNYYVCPEHHQPQCQIERHLYITHGSSTTSVLLRDNCPGPLTKRTIAQDTLNALLNVPTTFKTLTQRVLNQAEGVIPYCYFAEKFQTIGSCYATMLIMWDPWTRYQSNFHFRSVGERERKDVYVHSNDSIESFMKRYPNYVTSTLGDPHSMKSARAMPRLLIFPGHVHFKKLVIGKKKF